MTDNSAETELLALAERFPEINPNNYNEDDVIALNNWGCEVFDALRSTAATVSRDREAIAQALLDRFIARGMARMGGPTFPPGTKMASLPASYADDLYADADAILSIGSDAISAKYFKELMTGPSEEFKSELWRQKAFDLAERCDQLEAAASGAATMREAAPRWRHKKRGTEYTLVGHGQVQAEEPLTDYEVVAIYRGAEGYWVRRKSEFYDGRFEPLSPVLVQLVQGRRAQTGLSGNDGSEAKSGGVFKKPLVEFVAELSDDKILQKVDAHSNFFPIFVADVGDGGAAESVATGCSLREALHDIDGEAPSSRPSDGPTVAVFPPGSPAFGEDAEVLGEAFEQGAIYGRWQMAEIARAPLNSGAAPAVISRFAGGSTPLISDETAWAAEKAREMLAMGINIQATGEATNATITGILESLLAHIDELDADLKCAVAVGRLAARANTRTSPTDEVK